MSDRMTLLKAIVGGVALPTLVVGIAAAAPLANDPFITPIDGRLLAIAWWFLVPLGVAFSIIRSRRLWPGAIVGAWSVVGFHLSMVLLLDAAERADALWSGSGIVGALFAVAMPWVVGMAFGWSSIQSSPRRLDGVPGDHSRSTDE